MSNIGKKAVEVKQGVTVEIQNFNVKVTGPKGMLEFKLPEGVTVVQEEGKLVVKKARDERELEKFYGMTRTMISNLIKGVTDGFEKKLELIGVGYRAKVDGKDLVLNVGFATPVRINPLEGTSFAVEENIITVQGSSKQLVGDVASKIRKVRVPDPYKGKGIRYLGEHIRKKAGKAGKAAA